MHADKAAEIRDGYVYFTGEWSEGDVITFDFPMRTAEEQCPLLNIY